MSAEGRGVHSVEVGSRLLNALTSTGAPMMLRDVAKEAGIAPAQAHAYLVSYRKDQLVQQDEETGLYRLGPTALQLGLARLRAFDPMQAASEDASALARDSGLTVAVAVWGTYGPTVVQVHEGAGQVLINTRPGTVYSLTGTATGRVFAAYLPSDLIRETMKAQRSERQRPRYVGGLPELRAIEAEIEFVRANGYAPIESNPIPHVNALSAPVFEVGGQLHMVVTLIGPSATLDVSPDGMGVSQVLALSRRVSSRSGFFQFRTPDGQVRNGINR